MSDKGIWTTSPDGLSVPKKTPIYPEAEGYLNNIKKDLNHVEPIIRNYAELLSTNTEKLIAGEISIEKFEEISPNNLDKKVRHLNHMRDAIIRTWSLRESRLKRLEEEKDLWNGTTQRINSL